MARPSKRPSKKLFVKIYNNNSELEAAKFFKVSYTTINQWRKELGIAKKIITKSITKAVMPTKEEFEKIYLSASITNAALHFGVNPNLINIWRSNFGIACKSTVNLPTEFTTKQFELLVGSMLGDGSLKKPKSKNANSFFTETHCPAQYGYLKFKYDLLDKFSLNLKSKINYKNTNLHNGKYKTDYSQTSESFVLNTYASTLFTEMERKWYKRDKDGNYVLVKFGSVLQRVKILPPDLPMLTPFICAIWLSDDGNNRWLERGDKSITISSQSFTRDENDILVEMLKKLSIIHCKVSNKNKITILSKSFVDFVEMVKPHMPHECMAYKFAC